jgi:CheY-like chemotaxis protein
MKRLLLVDEEAGMEGREPKGNYMWYYWNALSERGFLVDQITTCDEALKRLLSGEPEYALVIVDLMMPPSEEQFHGGELRGAADVGCDLIARIHVAVPAIKIVVLTNVTDPAMLGRIEQMPGVVGVCEKLSKTPMGFAAIVDRLLKADTVK